MGFIGESKERVKERIKALASSRPAHVAGITLLLASTLTTSAYAATDKMVYLDVNGDSQTIETHASSVEEIFQQLNLRVDQNHYVEPELGTEIQEGMQIELAEKFPVQINDGGTIRIFYSAPTTVADFLKENDIVLSRNDRVEPALTTPITETSTIEITRVVRKIRVVTGSIANKVVVKRDANLEEGKQRVLNKGHKGSYTESFAIAMENGKVVSKVSMGRTIVKKPENKVVVKGTKKVPPKLKAIAYAKKFLGTEYVWGGETPSGFDCSGYISYVYANSLGISLPRTAAGMYAEGRSVSNLQKGDLVFFSNGSGISHVGMYIGGGLFINCASSKGVSISSLDNAYWGPRYVGAKRF